MQHLSMFQNDIRICEIMFCFQAGLDYLQILLYWQIKVKRIEKYGNIFIYNLERLKVHKSNHLNTITNFVEIYKTQNNSNWFLNLFNSFRLHNQFNSIKLHQSQEILFQIIQFDKLCFVPCQPFGTLKWFNSFKTF